jgi:iron complex outermembrane receptor protein
VALLAATISLTPLAARADTFDLANTTLEDLLNIEVTSVTKSAQKLLEAPSAIYVITAEDIRRSGYTTVPELLQMVPGLNVARFSSNAWAISTRSPNSIFTNDLLVMIDGRSVYTPLFAGTHWDLQNVPLEDIERIEVIRGPGGTVWGANAVSGVINIIRRRPDDPGDHVSVAAGDEQRVMTSFRTSKRAGPVSLQASGSYRYHDDSHSPSRGDAGDAWRQGGLSWAMDWQKSDDDLVTLQGDWYRGDPRQFSREDNLGSLATGVGMSLSSTETTTRGGNMLFKWNHRFSENTSTEAKFYWDRRTRNADTLSEDRQTYDGEFQANFRAGERHAFAVGGGARVMKDDLDNSLNFTFTPDSNDEAKYNFFIQDEITVIPDTLKLTLGSKFEWNTYTGWEVQPGIRAMWTPADRHQIWAAVSRSVRTPARVEREMDLLVVDVLTVPAVLPVTLSGNPDQDSEKMISYELGYRVQPTDETSIDIASFLNFWENEVGFPSVGPTNLAFDNREHSHTYGVEVAGVWQPIDWLRLTGSYSFFRVGREDETGAAPTHKFQIRSYLDLPGNFELDSSFIYFGRTRAQDGLLGTRIDTRTGLDVRLGWHPTDHLELSLVGQNLLRSEVEQTTHFINSAASGTQQIERAFYGKVTWRF